MIPRQGDASALIRVATSLAVLPPVTGSSPVPPNWIVRSFASTKDVGSIAFHTTSFPVPITAAVMIPAHAGAEPIAAARSVIVLPPSA
jgi:hypothetical protein